MSVETVPAPSLLADEPSPPAPALARARWESVRDSRWAVPAALLGLVLVAAWLRTRQFNFYYWVDEGISVGIAGHPLSHIPGVLRQDGSPPLYYLLLHVWMSIFGRGEIATHGLSLLFGLAIVPAAYWAGAGLWDRRAGLFCAALAAGLPYLNAYAQETRMYSMEALLALLVAAGFAHAYVRRRRAYLPLFSVALAAAMYTHNWADFLALACAVAFLVVVYGARGEARRALWRDAAIGFGAAALLYLPWVPTLLYQARHTAAPWDLPPVFWSITQAFYGLVGGRGAAMVVLLAGGLGLLTLRRGEGWRARLPASVESLLILGVGTLLIGWAYSKLSAAWTLRYFAVVAGPLLLPAGLGLARARALGLVGLALLGGFWILDPIPSHRESKSNVASVAAVMHPHLRSDPLIISIQPEQVPVLDHYLPKARYATPLGRTADPGVMDWRSALTKLRHASVRGTLMPLLASVAVGQRVLLVVPTNLMKVPAWMKLINHDSKAWPSALRRDRSFRLVKISAAGMGKAGVAVRGILYQRLR